MATATARKPENDETITLLKDLEEQYREQIQRCINIGGVAASTTHREYDMAVERYMQIIQTMYLVRGSG